eukprot:6207138-Pleurochrysis_carterae.AAC.2
MMRLNLDAEQGRARTARGRGMNEQRYEGSVNACVCKGVCVVRTRVSARSCAREATLAREKVHSSRRMHCRC